MKTMTCKQLGGACDLKFTGNTFEEIGQKSHQHGMEMAIAKDEAHLIAMAEMRNVMKDEEGMKKWMEDRKKEFEDLPEDE